MGSYSPLSDRIRSLNRLRKGNIVKNKSKPTALYDRTYENAKLDWYICVLISLLTVDTVEIPDTNIAKLPSPFELQEEQKENIAE